MRKIIFPTFFLAAPVLFKQNTDLFFEESPFFISIESKLFAGTHRTLLPPINSSSEIKERTPC